MSLLSSLQSEYKEKLTAVNALESELSSLKNKLATLQRQYELAQAEKARGELSIELEDLEAKLSQIKFYRERALEAGNEAEVARLEELGRLREAEIATLERIRTTPSEIFVELPLTRLKEPLESLPTRVVQPITKVEPKVVLAEAVPEEKKWPTWVPWVVVVGAGMLLLITIGKIWEEPNA